MEHLIEVKPGFKIVGLAVDTTPKKAALEVPLIWKEFMKKYKEISFAKGGMKNYGVCLETGRQNKFRYIACEEVSEFENIPEGMVMADVEASKYAVFTHKGLIKELGKTYEEAIKFMEQKGMNRKPFWIEFYDNRWKGDTPESEFEIWMAIE